MALCEQCGKALGTNGAPHAHTTVLTTITATGKTVYARKSESERCPLCKHTHRNDAPYWLCAIWQAQNALQTVHPKARLSPDALGFRAVAEMIEAGTITAHQSAPRGRPRKAVAKPQPAAFSLPALPATPAVTPQPADTAPSTPQPATPPADTAPVVTTPPDDFLLGDTSTPPADTSTAPVAVPSIDLGALFAKAREKHRPRAPSCCEGARPTHSYRSMTPCQPIALTSYPYSARSAPLTQGSTW